MTGLPAETCEWKYHNKSKLAKLNAFCWFLIYCIQINALDMERINTNYYLSIKQSGFDSSLGRDWAGIAQSV